MCKLFKFILFYLFINVNKFNCLDDYNYENDYNHNYDHLDFIEEDNNLDKLVNLIDSEIMDVTQKVDNLINEIEIHNSFKPTKSSLIETSIVKPINLQSTNGIDEISQSNNFLFSNSNQKTETKTEFRKKIINKLEKQIKKDINEYKFNKAIKLTCLRKNLIVEHDRLNQLEKIKNYKTIDLIQSSLNDHISWFTNYSEHQMLKENQPVQEEYLDGNGLADILINIVNFKFIYPNQPFKIKKNNDGVIYNLKPFVILDAEIDAKNSSEKITLIRSSQFYLKNDVDEKHYLLKGNLSLALILNMKNKFELLYNYLFNTSIDTNLIGNVELRYFYEESKFDISIIEILDYEHFDIKNNFNFIQGLIINPVISTIKPRIMDAIKDEG